PEVGSAAGARIVEERRLLEQVRRQSLWVGNWRGEVPNLRGEGREPILDQVRDTVRKIVCRRAEGSAKPLNPVVRVSVLTRRLVINGTACAKQRLRIELIGGADSGPERIFPQFTE